MRQPSSSEKMMIEEVAQSAITTQKTSKGLSIGSLIKMIRSQLGMSQSVLAKRAKVPQSSISRLEKGEKNVTLSTLNKILDAMFCDLVAVPMLREPIDTIRRKQAQKQAERHVQYLKGTMSLEQQQPDPMFINELLKQEENRLLISPGSNLWKN